MPQYNLAPFVATPFRFTLNAQGDAVGPVFDADEDSGPRHPICKVLEWEQRLQSENSLTRAQLAREEGITKAHVTQIMRLTNLPEEARQYLTALRSPETIRSFSLRRLAMVAKLPADRRGEAFDAMKMISSGAGADSGGLGGRGAPAIPPVRLHGMNHSMHTSQAARKMESFAPPSKKSVASATWANIRHDRLMRRMRKKESWDSKI